MSDSTWPPKDVSTPTVSHKDSVIAMTGSTVIDAPASLVFDIVMDTSTYSEWCTFVKVVVDKQPPADSTTEGQNDSSRTSDTKLQLGTKFTFFASMTTGQENSKTNPTRLIVSDISTPSRVSSYIPSSVLTNSAVYTSDLSSVYRVAWKVDKVDFVSRGLNSERFHEVIVKGEEQCEVRTWEVMGGVFAYAVKWMYKKTLDQKFVEWCTDLKGFAEKKWLEQKSQES